MQCRGQVWSLLTDPFLNSQNSILNDSLKTLFCIEFNVSHEIQWKAVSCDTMKVIIATCYAMLSSSRASSLPPTGGPPTERWTAKWVSVPTRQRMNLSKVCVCMQTCMHASVHFMLFQILICRRWKILISRFPQLLSVVRKYSKDWILHRIVRRMRKISYTLCHWPNGRIIWESGKQRFSL